MTGSDLRAWQASMGYSYAQALAALGVAKGTYARMLSGESKMDRRTALACAAVAAGIEEWQAQPKQAISQDKHDGPAG